MDIPKKILSDGFEIPIIGFGTWQLKGKQCINVLKKALEIGYRHIDTAYAYYNQKQVGEMIKKFPRHEIFLTTKLWRDHLDPKKIEWACDFCLKELQLDYIDLFLIHWPNREKPMEDIAYEMLRLKEKGKIKIFGVSNYTIHHLQNLLSQKIDITVNQVEYHPYCNQEDLLTFCKKYNIVLTAYCPMAHGEITTDPVLEDIGQKHKKSAGQVSLRWLVQKGLVIIPKTSSEKHMRENLEIFDFSLSIEEMEKIDSLNDKKIKRIIQPDFHEFNY